MYTIIVKHTVLLHSFKEQLLDKYKVIKQYDMTGSTFLGNYCTSQMS